MDSRNFRAHNIARMSLISEDEKARSPLWAINPQSRRLILKDGPTYARLVKMGLIDDPALRQQWEEKREAERARRIAAATEARAIGIGPAGGVMSPKVPPNFAAARAPDPPPRRDNLRPRADDCSRIWGLAVENKAALSRHGLTREEAADLLRSAWAAKHHPAQPEEPDPTPDEAERAERTLARWRAKQSPKVPRD
jgi:hypothetical protein